MPEATVSSPRFLFVSGLPREGQSEAIGGDGFAPPRLLVRGTASFLGYMPELFAAGRTLWLSRSGPLAQMTIPKLPLVNYMADPDVYEQSLRKAQLLHRQSQLPMFNRPVAVANTRRDRSAEILNALPGVRSPRTLRLSRSTRAELIEAIEASGLTFPLLLRPAGLHGGRHLVRVDDQDGLNAAHIRLGLDDAVYVSEYVDFADADGLYRKQRLIFVGRQVFWRHMIIGERWLLHSDGRAPGTEAEEAASLADFETKALPRLAPTLDRIRTAVGLDYFGVDCSLRPDGTLLVFEANACMNALDNTTIPPPNMWEAPIASIHRALHELIEHPERWLSQPVAAPAPAPVRAMEDA